MPRRLLAQRPSGNPRAAHVGRGVIADTIVVEVGAFGCARAATGTLETPVLLEPSGFGDPDRFRSIGVDARVASPLVGEGLREQRNATVKVRPRPGLGLNGRLASRLALGVPADLSALPWRPSGGTAAVAMAVGHRAGTWIGEEA